MMQNLKKGVIFAILLVLIGGMICGIAWKRSKTQSDKKEKSHDEFIIRDTSDEKADQETESDREEQKASDTGSKKSEHTQKTQTNKSGKEKTDSRGEKKKRKKTLEQKSATIPAEAQDGKIEDGKTEDGKTEDGDNEPQKREKNELEIIPAE